MKSKEFLIKAIIPQDDSCITYTVYLYCDDLRILLPITTNRHAVESMLFAKTMQSSLRPSLFNTVKRVLLSLDASVVSIEIYKCLDEIFYAYIVVKNALSIYHIDAKVTDAICFAFEFRVSIVVYSEVYENFGIHVTKELLERSMSSIN